MDDDAENVDLTGDSPLPFEREVEAARRAAQGFEQSPCVVPSNNLLFAFLGYVHLCV
jgi:hypothetical protein